MDIVNSVEKHPLPGETIKSRQTQYTPGGKGANQAIAAALAGGTVTMIGAVGQDAMGSELQSNIQSFGAETKHILIKEGTSGLAFITVNQLGGNTIILSEGANAKLTEEDVKQIISNSTLDQVDTVLLQNEIPWQTTLFAIKEAHRRGIRIMFNPAPALMLTEDILSLIDVLILNETEAEMITNHKVGDRKEALKAAQQLVNGGVTEVILTLGDKGSIYVNQKKEVIITPAFKVLCVDSTAAGDAFIGAFAASSRGDYSTEESLRFAAAAAAITVTRDGAQMSIPNAKEIKGFLLNRVNKTRLI
jgi:ribokinase